MSFVDFFLKIRNSKAFNTIVISVILAWLLLVGLIFMILVWVLLILVWVLLWGLRKGIFVLAWFFFVFEIFDFEKNDLRIEALDPLKLRHAKF